MLLKPTEPIILLPFSFLKTHKRVLSAEELKLAMYKKDNLYVLPSAHILTDLRHYKPKNVEFLVNLCSKTFDVVIIDAGWYANNGLFIGSINSSPYRYMVTTQQESSKLKYLYTKEQILKVFDINSKDIMLVINRYSDLIDLPDPYKLADESYDMVYAATLPNISGVYHETESTRRTLRGYSKDYDQALSMLTKIIANQIDIKLKDAPEKKKSFDIFNLFKKNGNKKIVN